MTRALMPLLRELRIAYYRWARSEMAPMHPDVPFVTLRLRELEESRRA